MSDQSVENLPPPLADLNISSPIEQFERLKKKGTKTKVCITEEEKDFIEWKMKTTRDRDCFAGYLGDVDLINFFAVAENETKARVKFMLIDKMLQPCGPPPKVPIPNEKKKKGKKQSKTQLIDAAIPSTSKEDETSDEDIEKNAALKDALQCTFVQQVFDGVYHNSNLSTLPLPEKSVKKENSGTFEDNIAKVLARRLDETIEETKSNSCKSVQQSNKRDECGIQLIKSGKIITNNDLTNTNISNDKIPQVLPKKANIKSKIYEERAQNIAVSSEWVKSKDNTKYWKDNKRPRIINMKTIKSADKGATICRVLTDE